MCNVHFFFVFLQSEFYGQIVVGSPGKTFQLLLDTTWSYSWILSSDCDTEVIGCCKFFSVSSQIIYYISVIFQGFTTNTITKNLLLM